jgi:hypothetical protein
MKIETKRVEGEKGDGVTEIPDGWLACSWLVPGVRIGIRICTKNFKEMPHLRLRTRSPCNSPFLDRSLCSMSDIVSSYLLPDRLPSPSIAIGCVVGYTRRDAVSVVGFRCAY